jgi:hypothetical protein
MSKIKIGEEYNYDTGKVEPLYSDYKLCKCIKQKEFSTKNWLGPINNLSLNKNKYFEELENYKYIIYRGSYVVFLEDDFYDTNSFSKSEFDNYFFDLSEWRNKQISALTGAI